MANKRILVAILSNLKFKSKIQNRLLYQQSTNVDNEQALKGFDHIPGPKSKPYI